MIARWMIAFALGLAVLGSPVRAADPLSELARDVDRAESVHAVLNLQRTYAQYAQYGLWMQLGDLFAPGGSFVFDGQVTPGQTVKGPRGIAAFLRTRYGGGHEGLKPGGLSTMMIETPIISLSPDGRTAKGRWHILVFHGHEGKARIEGGIFENDYVREGGIWKIATARYFPQFDGAYEDGWTNWGGGDLPIVPYHFTPDTAGVPIPPATGDAPKSKATLASLQKRIAALNEEDRIRNLQAMYGFYATGRCGTM